MESVSHQDTIGHRKIQSHHHQRLACIYIRQSTTEQVRHHRESRLNQERMAERAHQLGWPAEQVQLITEDLGKSGSGSHQRSGFRNLLSDISLGKVGIVFCYEVSRLARNSRDWHHLLEASGLFDTLIADYDGIYDLHHFNDRLLLGLKGTMSEAELHLLKLRMAAGRKRQLERGAYRQILPTGLVRIEDGVVIKDPDEQVRQVIGLVFDTFARLKSCSKVLQYFHQEKILLPRRQIRGPDAGTVVWREPTAGSLYSILTNPAYAGTFVYGRRPMDKSQPIGNRLNRPRRRPPIESWAYVHHDHYPAYISWEVYLENRRLLTANRQHHWHPTRDEAGAIRQGNALLQGMVYCGYCGHQLHTLHKGTARYGCYARKRMYGGNTCTIINADYIDPVVVEAFFTAVQPAQLDVLESVLREQNEAHTQLAQQWQQRLQRAQYEAHLAQRQYNAVDPENRLVAAELERRWEAKLQALATTQREVEQFEQRPSPTLLTPQLRQQFQTICDNLPVIWDELTNQEKKSLLRSLIKRVILTRVEVDRVAIRVVWLSSHYSAFDVHVGTLKASDLPFYDNMIAQIHQLWQKGVNDITIAAKLTAKGYHSARSDHLSAETVGRLRLEHGWRRNNARDHVTLAGHLSVLKLADLLGVSRTWVYGRIRRGLIPTEFITRHPKYDRLFIRNDPQVLATLQEMKKNARSK
jgi:DNA invertase Pin-like site-specific DNA recombinase